MEDEFEWRVCENTKYFACNNGKQIPFVSIDDLFIPGGCSIERIQRRFKDPKLRKKVVLVSSKSAILLDIYLDYKLIGEPLTREVLEKICELELKNKKLGSILHNLPERGFNYTWNNNVLMIEPNEEKLRDYGLDF